MERLEKLRKPILAMDPSELRELVTFIRADRQRSKAPISKPKTKKAKAPPKERKTRATKEKASKAENKKTTDLMDALANMSPAEREAWEKGEG